MCNSCRVFRLVGYLLSANYKQCSDPTLSLTLLYSRLAVSITCNDRRLMAVNLQLERLPEAALWIRTHAVCGSREFSTQSLHFKSWAIIQPHLSNLLIYPGNSHFPLLSPSFTILPHFSQCLNYTYNNLFLAVVLPRPPQWVRDGQRTGEEKEILKCKMSLKEEFMFLWIKAACIL